MDVLANLRDLTTVFSDLGIILIGGIVTFFIIKYQVTKDLQVTVSIYKDELEAMKIKINSLQDQLINNQRQIVSLITEKEELKFKKDYLKNIVIQALANKVSVDQTLSKELNSMLKTK